MTTPYAEPDSVTNEPLQETDLGLVANAPFGIYVVDHRFRLVRISQGARKVFSVVQDALGRDFEEVLRTIWPEPFVSEALGRFRHTLATGESYHAPSTVEQRAGSGDTEAYDWKLDRLQMPDGHYGVVCYFFDLTERQKAKEEMAAVQERYQAFVKNSSEGIWRCELDRPMPLTLPKEERLDYAYANAYMAECNDAMARMYGYEHGEELVGARLGDLIPRTPENEAYLMAFFENDFKFIGGESAEKHRDGHTVYFSNNLVGIVENDHLVRVWGTQADITANRHAEAELRESEERIRLAADTGRVGIWEWIIASDRIIWSDVLYDIQGVRKEEFGGGVRDFSELVHPEDRERVGRAIERTLKEDVPYEVDFRAVRPVDGKTIWLHTNARVLRDDTGQPVRLLGAVVETTRQKQHEEALREADRRKDEFLATLAHELRNPLAPLRNGLELLSMATNEPATVADITGRMSRQVDQMVHLVNDLLDLSRVSRGVIELRLQPVDLNEAISLALEMNQTLIQSKRQELHKDLGSSPLRVNGDLTRLAQIFGNLLDNAAKYTPEGGRVVLSARRSDGMAEITVSDTGIGIHQDQLPLVFDMFSQVDRSHARTRGGLGIGLHIVKRLVDMHGGTIEAASEGLSQGSRFTVRIPLSGEQGDR